MVNNKYRKLEKHTEQKELNRGFAGHSSISFLNEVIDLVLSGVVQ